MNAAMHTADCIKTKKEPVTEAGVLSAYVQFGCLLTAVMTVQQTEDFSAADRGKYVRKIKKRK